MKLNRINGNIVYNGKGGFHDFAVDLYLRWIHPIKYLSHWDQKLAYLLTGKYLEALDGEYSAWPFNYRRIICFFRGHRKSWTPDFSYYWCYFCGKTLGGVKNE